MSKLKAVNNRVIVYVEPVTERKTAGGIILSADSNAEGPVRVGVVLDVGPGDEAKTLQVQPDDRVAFYKGHADAVKEVDGYFSVEAKNILYAIVDLNDTSE